MRVFVATLLSVSNQRWCAACIKALVRQHRGALRGIPEGTAHLTHVFCASLAGVSLDRFVDTVRETSARLPASSIRLGGLTAIPPGPRPRLVCLDVLTGATELSRLSRALVAGVRRAYPTLELDPAKSAHATLARFCNQTTAREAREVTSSLDTLSRELGERDESLDHVDVISSTLTPAGPVYQVVARLPMWDVESA
jgi:2'-5' RNA ligase